MHSPKGVYKGSQTSCGDAQISRHSTGNIYGEHATDGKLQAEANRAHPDDNGLTQELGAHYQQQKVSPGTLSRNQISGNDSKLPDNGLETAWGEDQENQMGSSPL